MKKHLSLLLSAAICVSACGGGGGGGSAAPPPPPPPSPPPLSLTGQFKDANVSGLSFSTTTHSGITNAMGVFNYQFGETVEFSVGGVVIGFATGGDIITPIDLVVGGTSENTEVRNIVRFLMMLDENEDPTDGISISQSVRDVATNWTQVDFATNDLANELVMIISDVSSVDNRTAPLPSASAASDHLTSTAHCVMSGYFVGSYSGDRAGTIVVIVNPATGRVFARIPGSPVDYETDDPISVDDTRTFVADANDGSSDNFEGRFDSYDQISGVWTLGSDTGSFMASRVLSDPSATYRFTGEWHRDVIRPRMEGPLVLNVDAQGNLDGESTEIATGAVYTAMGSFDGSDFDYDWTTASGTDAGNRTGTVDGNLYVEGTGSNNAGATRPWIAQGCRLN